MPACKACKNFSLIAANSGVPLGKHRVGCDCACSFTLPALYALPCGWEVHLHIRMVAVPCCAVSWLYMYLMSCNYRPAHRGSYGLHILLLSEGAVTIIVRSTELRSSWELAAYHAKAMKPASRLHLCLDTTCHHMYTWFQHKFELLENRASADLLCV